MSKNQAKLSLTSHFDDIVRRSNMILSADSEFEERLQNELVSLLKQRFEDNKKAGQLMQDLEDTRRQLSEGHLERKKLETKLCQTKHLLVEEVKKRTRIETHAKHQKNQLSVIKDVMSSYESAFDENTKVKLASLYDHPRTPGQNASLSSAPTIGESSMLLTSADFSFDQTAEDVLEPEICQSPQSTSVASSRASQTKRKISETGSNKKLKLVEGSSRQNGEGDKFESDQDHHQGHQLVACCSSKVDPRFVLTEEPSKAFDNPLKTTLETWKKHAFGYGARSCVSDSKAINRMKTRSYKELLNKFSPRTNVASPAQTIDSHDFDTKTTFIPENCDYCYQRTKFSKHFLKCKRCNCVVHLECKDKVKSLCYMASSATTFTPSERKEVKYTLQNYVPLTSPMVPRLVLRCTMEIESRGLNTIGLYRVSGNEKKVKELNEKFIKAKQLPCFSKTDIHVLCSLVKEFLRSMDEPIITRLLWSEFSAAANSEKVDKLKVSESIISKLPQANLETLAFLILHLKRVASSPECKMPVKNLCKVFGPTIVGYSSDNLTEEEIVEQTMVQWKVMKLLLTSPRDFWKSLVPVLEALSFATPVVCTVGAEILGGTSETIGGGSIRQGLTPRSIFVGTFKNKNRLFSSPLLK